MNGLLASLALWLEDTHLPFGMLIATHRVAISIPQGKGGYCLITMRLFYCQPKLPEKVCFSPPPSRLGLKVICLPFTEKNLILKLISSFDEYCCESEIFLRYFLHHKDVKTVLFFKITFLFYKSWPSMISLSYTLNLNLDTKRMVIIFFKNQINA